MKKLSQRNLMAEIKNNWPLVSRNEQIIIKKILRSGKLNYWSGNCCKKFEKSFSNYFNIKFSLSMCNGSVALDCALKALNLKKNSEVIVTSRSYISSASCVINNNLVPVFSDIDISTQNIELDFIKKKITKKTKAIIVVHLGGMPADMIKIMKFAKKNKILVIEDCSQAHGAKIKNKFVGCFGDISVWSFCNDKIMNTLGEGAVLATNNKKYYQKVWSIRDCGKNIEKVKKLNNKKDYKFKWIHDFAGSNYRMTELQAAIGDYQIKKLKKWVKIRRKYAYTIKKILSDYKSVSFFLEKKNFYNSFYRFYIKINPEYLNSNWDINKIIQLLNQNKIICNYGSCPEIYNEKVFKDLGYRIFNHNAKLLNGNTIAFNIHPYLSKQYSKQLKIVLSKIFSKATKE
jgi:dTDP-4-amino-4,6-dideoxygalactose transaminase